MDYIMPSNADHRKQRGRTAPNRALRIERIVLKWDVRPLDGKDRPPKRRRFIIVVKKCTKRR